jgi:hypothetical protein
MTWAVIAEGVVILALLALIAYVLQLRERRERAVTEERRELLNRIQAPERIPLPMPTQFTIPELEEDESAAVGTIVYDERYGEEE